ncbi:MAG: hypothetical protein K2K96_01550 [Lachnospiraceae bacterium]|nr:hypothetical protein [Lachnospiraceae bacterium]
MQNSPKALMEKIGIKKLFEVPHGKLQGSTVLATNGKENLTVSQMLKSAEYLINFIKDNFDVDEFQYSITIIFLKSVQLVLNNGRADKPSKENAHIIIDVLHEIADIHAKNECEKELNEDIAVSLKCLIETLN